MLLLVIIVVLVVVNTALAYLIIDKHIDESRKEKRGLMWKSSSPS